MKYFLATILLVLAITVLVTLDFPSQEDRMVSLLVKDVVSTKNYSCIELYKKVTQQPLCERVGSIPVCIKNARIIPKGFMRQLTQKPTFLRKLKGALTARNVTLHNCDFPGPDEIKFFCNTLQKAAKGVGGCSY